MKILFLCWLAVALIFLLHRWNRISIIDYTKQHRSKLYKQIAVLMVITVSLMIYTAISIIF
jgi:hypothetical protein